MTLLQIKTKFSISIMDTIGISWICSSFSFSAHNNLITLRLDTKLTDVINSAFVGFTLIALKIKLVPQELREAILGTSNI